MAAKKENVGADKRPEWEVKKDGVVYEHGYEDTMLSAQVRKIRRAGGYEIYFNGKLYTK